MRECTTWVEALRGGRTGGRTLDGNIARVLVWERDLNAEELSAISVAMFRSKRLHTLILVAEMAMWPRTCQLRGTMVPSWVRPSWRILHAWDAQVKRPSTLSLATAPRACAVKEPFGMRSRAPVLLQTSPTPTLMDV